MARTMLALATRTALPATSSRLIPELPGEGLHGAARGIAIDRHAAAQEGLGAQGAADQVGIGDGRLDATPPITRRPRLGPGAARPDPQHAAFIEPDDGAAAGAHRVDIKHRDADSAGARC